MARSTSAKAGSHHSGSQCESHNVNTLLTVQIIWIRYGAFFGRAAPKINSQFLPSRKISFHTCNLIEAAPGVHPA